MSSATSPPIKPPRGIKSAKETSGILRSLICTVAASTSSTEREEEKAKLEREFVRSERRLEELVGGHEGDLALVLGSFGQVAPRVEEALERIRHVRERLGACRTLLHCKREDLRKLWLQALENKHELRLLQQIEELVEVPPHASTLMASRKLRQGTRLVMSSLELLEGSLRGVDALGEVHTELLTQRERLHRTLLKELRSQIYIDGLKEAWGVLGGGVGGGRNFTPFQRRGSERASRRKLLQEVNVKATFLDIPKPEQDIDTELDLDTLSAEERPELYLGLLVECIALLRRLPDSLEVLQHGLQKELQGVVANTTRQMLQEASTRLGTTDYPPEALLPDLMQVLCEQFRIIVTSYSCVLQHSRRLAQTKSLQLPPFDVPDVWSAIQSVMQVVLSDYLDVGTAKGVGEVPLPASYAETASATADIGSHFARRKGPGPRNVLFKFAFSSVALSASSYLRELRAEASSTSTSSLGSERPRVCPADPRHLTLIFGQLMSFITEIESALGCPPGTDCALHSFVSELIQDVFLGQVHRDVTQRVEAATHPTQAWVVAQSPPHVLQGATGMAECVEELRGLMASLPLYPEYFLSMLCNALAAYREACMVAYRSLVHPAGQPKPVMSAGWIRDEDIRRYLTTRPDWLRLRSSSQVEGEAEEDAESDQEMALLIGNLQDTKVPSWGILDPGQVKQLALLHESLDWLGLRISQAATEAAEGTKDASEEGAFSHTLLQLARDFQDLSDTSLLLLQLEVRMHCFHFLLPLLHEDSWAPEMDSQVPDPDVLRLGKDLASLDEVLGSVLDPRKARYVFWGLDRLLAAILISSAPSIQKISPAGVKRMQSDIFALQQALSAITLSRAAALDRARMYYELFLLGPSELLAGALDHGAQFPYVDYLHALQLMHRSRPVQPDEQLQAHLTRLSAILGEVGVTV